MFGFQQFSCPSLPESVPDFSAIYCRFEKRPKLKIQSVHVCSVESFLKKQYPLLPSFQLCLRQQHIVLGFLEPTFLCLSSLGLLSTQPAKHRSNPVPKAPVRNLKLEKKHGISSLSSPATPILASFRGPGLWEGLHMWTVTVYTFVSGAKRTDANNSPVENHRITSLDSQSKSIAYLNSPLAFLTHNRHC